MAFASGVVVLRQSNRASPLPQADEQSKMDAIQERKQKMEVGLEAGRDWLGGAAWGTPAAAWLAARSRSAAPPRPWRRLGGRDTREHL